MWVTYSHSPFEALKRLHFVVLFLESLTPQSPVAAKNLREY